MKFMSWLQSQAQEMDRPLQHDRKRAVRSGHNIGGNGRKQANKIMTVFDVNTVPLKSVGNVCLKVIITELRVFHKKVHSFYKVDNLFEK